MKWGIFHQKEVIQKEMSYSTFLSVQKQVNLRAPAKTLSLDTYYLELSRERGVLAVWVTCRHHRCWYYHLHSHLVKRVHGHGHVAAQLCRYRSPRWGPLQAWEPEFPSWNTMQLCSTAQWPWKTHSNLSPGSQAMKCPVTAAFSNITPT